MYVCIIFTVYNTKDISILIKLTDLMKVKEESEKVGLKLNIHKSKIMASGPITSWEIDGETVDLSDPGIEPASFVYPALGGRFFTTSATLDFYRGKY